MSAIGSCAVLRRHQLDACLAHAGRAQPAEFAAAWQAALVRRLDFDYSGYVLGNYLDAQGAVNGESPVDELSEASVALSQVFTAGFLFDRRIELPDLDRERLAAFCREEYGADGAGMMEAITAAHDFYRRGLAEITPEQVVVFVIE